MHINAAYPQESAYTVINGIDRDGRRLFSSVSLNTIIQGNNQIMLVHERRL